MLQAVVHRKAAQFVLREPRRRPIEDIILSSVFGPLDYQPARVSWRVLSYLFELDSVDFNPITAAIEFWPHPFGAAVEPDIVASFGDGQRRVDVVIEAKWNSGAQHQQLLKQWKAFSEPPREIWHRFLVRTLPTATAHLEECDNAAAEEGLPSLKRWKESRKTVLWQDVLRKLRVLGGYEQPAIAKWARHVVVLLEAFREREFVGFSRFADEAKQILPGAGPSDTAHADERQRDVGILGRFSWPLDGGLIGSAVSCAFFSTDGRAQI